MVGHGVVLLTTVDACRVAWQVLESKLFSAVAFIEPSSEGRIISEAYPPLPFRGCSRFRRYMSRNTAIRKKGWPPAPFLL